jgi:hypothetical protein
MSRDDFTKDVIDTLSKRVACRCSNPDCGRITAGPHSNATKWVNVGVAAHVTAAAPGGPRYDPALTPEERKGILNGIWLCQDCAKMIDSDPDRYPVPLLRQWKAQAEAETERLMANGLPLAGSGQPLAVSEPLMIGTTPYCLVGNEQLPIAPIEEPDEDPTFYVSAFVFRTVVQPATPSQTVIIQGFGAEVLNVEAVPPYRPLMGAYPTALSLYRLVFDDPRKASSARFIASKYYSVKEEGGGEERTIQPVAIDPVLPETFDIRLSPRSPGLFTLRIFVMVSVGVRVTEQNLIASLKIVVPPVEKYSPNFMG